MKAPTKAQLREQIEALTRENIELRRQLNAEKQKKWREKVDQAFDMIYTLIPFHKSEIYNMTLCHIDDSGYWFEFKLRVDDQLQTFCVRHTDL